MLKRTFFLVAALFSGVAALAQDLIVKIDSTRIEARVAEISPEQVRYKRFARPDGPTYVLPTAQICYIRYADGFIEDYNRTKTPVVAAQPVPEAPAVQPAPVPVQQPQPASTPAPQAVPAPAPQATPAPAPTQSIFAPSENYVIRYAIGQIYDQNGVRGIVCADVASNCARCAGPAQTHVEAELEEAYVRDTGDERMEALDEDQYTYSGHVLELDDAVRTALLLELPSRILCKEDCKGLCSQCGADLNINECSCQKDLIRKNPFSALASLLNEDEEV